MDMTNKTVLITGASRGIGADTARVFASQGADVFLLARSEGAINALADELGEKAVALACDVARFGDVNAAVKAAVDKTGRLDVVINNAGLIEPVSRMSESDPEAWGEVIDVNLKGVYYGMRAALPIMQKQGHGTILTISSGAAHSPLEGWSQYCASKAGAAMLTRCAHKEHGEEGLRIMGLSPGTVATEMQVVIKASGVNPVSQLDPSVHIPADWPARAMLWMCSPDADEFLGEEISLRDEAIRARVGLIR
jgi:NAD(P)-dependent dehydrogenase (short-subunit alcohol dehydrogenase family)